MDFQLDRYLKRIGYTGFLNRNLKTLTAIHAAHVDAIPFDGFDPLLRRQVNLDMASIQAKLIDSRRGGYCHEQNVLFKAALEAIGFTVTSLGGRVRWNSPENSPLGPKEHTLLKVDCAEGSYISDVGFGACVSDAPIRFDCSAEKHTPMSTYRLRDIDGLFWLSTKRPTGWRYMYAFDLVPQLQSDIELANWFTSTSPRVPFTSKLIMERIANNRRYKLIDRRLLIEAQHGDIVNERSITSPDELVQILDAIFNVSAPAPVELIFPRLG